MQESMCIRCQERPVADRPGAKVCEQCFLGSIADLFERDDLREKLAEYAHEAWSGWMAYMFAQGGVTETMRVEGEGFDIWMMKPEKYNRWQRQMNTEFSALPAEEQKSDYEEADKMMAIIDGMQLSQQEPTQ